MITTVYYKPSYLQGAYNPIVWSVLSNKTTEVDFKYVFDLYIDGVFQIRFKQRANPSSAGMIDVGTAVQAFLVSGPPNTSWTQGETQIDPALGKAYLDNGTLSCHVHLQVGEEYSTAGVSSIYNGVTNEVGEPAYLLYSASNSITDNIPVHVWPSSVEYQKQQWGMSNATGYSGAYGSNPVDGILYDWGQAYYAYDGNTAHALNHAGSSMDLYAFDKMTLSYINWSSYSDVANFRVIYGFRYVVKNAAGTTLYTLNLPVITPNGSGPRTACTTGGLTDLLDPEYDLLHVLAGPDDIAKLLDYHLSVEYGPQPGDTIEIQGYLQAVSWPSTCNFGDPVTDKVTITVKEYCESTLYQRVRLSWLNDLGGRDYQNFTQFLEKEVSTTNDTYSQEQVNWSDTTPVPIGVTDPAGYLTLQGGNKVYNKMANRSWTIQTDWLNQAQVDLLQGLQKSPQVFAYIHVEGNTWSDYAPFPVTIKEASYKVKNVNQNKLTQGQFQIDLALPQKLQNT
jgi:hypothetical protein